MESGNREILTQIAVLDIMRELNLGLDSEPEDEIYDRSIFSFEYRPLDRNGCENGRRRRVFNMQKSNLLNLVKIQELDSKKIDELLLESRGLNVLPKLYQNDAPEYEPKVIFRRIPIDYGSFYSTPMNGILVEGTDETYLEVSWDKPEEPNALFSSLRESDPLFQLLPFGYEAITKFYNKKVKRALKGVFLVESIRLMEDMTGHHKNPFDFRGLHNLRRELGDIRGVNRSNYLTTDVEWLDKINDSMGGWAYSVYQIQQTELKDSQDFFKNSLEKMTRNLQLENTRLWDYERNEPGVYIQYLKEALLCYKILAEMNADASQKLFARLRDMAKDFGDLLEKVIDR